MSSVTLGSRVGEPRRPDAFLLTNDGEEAKQSLTIREWIVTKPGRQHALFIVSLLLVGVVRSGSVLGQPTGEFLCSAGSNDGRPCDTDDDCPGGVCVIAQGVCDGGEDDGSICDCAGGTCATQPVCADDQTLGTCSGGTSAGECCDPTFNCTGGTPCRGTQKVCFSGTAKGFSCLRDAQCPGSTCCSTGKYCEGGDFDSFACVDNNDCPGTPKGTCVGTGGNCVVPSPTRTPSRGPTTPSPTRSKTPTRTPLPTTASPTPITTVIVTPTPSATVRPLATARLVSSLTATDPTISVDNAATFPNSGTMQIDGEQISYSGKFGNTFTGLARGVNGTAPAEHATGSVVSLLSSNVATPSRPTPTEPPRGHIIRVIGEGGGCAVRPPSRQSGSPVVMIGVGLAVAMLRKRRRR